MYRKNKIRKKIKKLMFNVKSKTNWLYFTIVAMFVIGVGMLGISFFISTADVKNVLVGLGTGTITSSLVTLGIEMSNNRIDMTRTKRVKKLLFNPIVESMKSVYNENAYRINRYTIKQKNDRPILPLYKGEAFKLFIDKLEGIELRECIEEERDNLKELLDIPAICYKEFLTLYKAIPFESLLLENIISQQEYDELKNFELVERCVESLGQIDNSDLENQDKYIRKVDLLGNIQLLVNRMIMLLEYVEPEMEYNDEQLMIGFDNLYFNEVYSKSDEYMEKELDYQMHLEKYYEEHPEEL